MISPITVQYILQLPDCTTVAVSLAFLVLIPGLITGMQKKIVKMSCVLSKTANITVWILEKINQEMGELQVTKPGHHKLSTCKRTLRLGMISWCVCFTISDYSHQIKLQVQSLKDEVARISMVNDF